VKTAIISNVKGTQSNGINEEVRASVFCNHECVLLVDLLAMQRAAELYAASVAGCFL